MYWSLTSALPPLSSPQLLYLCVDPSAEDGLSKALGGGRVMDVKLTLVGVA